MLLCRRFAFLVAALLLAGCVTVPTEPRAVWLDQGYGIRVQTLNCAEALDRSKSAHASAAALDPKSIRIFTWNIHKQSDRGWQSDLDAFAQESDLVLLQELVLTPEIRGILEGAGLQWAMASSFLDSNIDIGVLTAARVTPVATCTQRVVEPLLRLPKSSVVTWYALHGADQTLAVVNMHSINFSLTLGAYRTQLAAMRDALAKHDGPIIFAGDLNTWTVGRIEAVNEATAALGLTEVKFETERRKVFWGKQLDHIFVRGLSVSDSDALPLTSSDHYPVQATVQLR